MCMICDASREVDLLQLKLAAIADGTLIDVAPQSEEGVESYALRAEDIGPVVLSMEGDIAADSSTTASIAIGETVTGVLEVVGDRDWYAVELEAGQRYTALLQSFEVNGDAIGDAYLRLVDASGNVIAFNDDGAGNFNSLLTYQATESGTFYLSAGAYNDGALDGTYDPDGQGGYRLSFDETEPLRDYSVAEIADVLTGAVNGGTPIPIDISQSTEITYNISAIRNPDVIPLIEAALAAWAELTPLTFRQVETADATFQFVDNEEGAFAESTFSGGFRSSVRINVSEEDWIDRYGTDLNSYSYHTYLHEIGHALGLGHGGPYNGSAVYGVDNIYLNDTWGTTVMSYFDQEDAGFGDYRLVLGLQAADIVAIQNLYGANETTRNGDTVYGYNTTETGSIFDFQNWADQDIQIPSFSIYDTGGIDTLDLSPVTADQTISLVPNTWSSIGNNGRTGEAMENLISISRDAVIENAIGGSGDDTFFANSADNVITGGAGSDTVVTLATDAADVVVTANADGSYTLSSAQDGSDTLIGIESVTIGANTIAIADLVTTTDPEVTDIFGTNNDDTLFGTEGGEVVDALDGNDYIRTYGGDDTVYGRGGDDRLIGDGGNDALYGGNGADVLLGFDDDDRLYGGEGRDSLVGGNGNDIGYGGDGNDRVQGNFGNDRLFGEAGADVLIGGSGDDYLAGGLGNDQLYGSNDNDTILGGDGNDRLFGQRGNDSVEGGEGADVIVGGDGTDDLSGGAGRDFIIGGSGNDTLSGGDDNDRLYASDGNDILTGGAGDDRLEGQFGDDELSGGTGRDFLIGGAGIDELDGGEGNDLLFGGDDDDTLIGGAGRDRLQGQSGNDRLLGGDGVDVLIGGEGDDSLFGDDGEDFLFGGFGDDLLEGGLDNDRLTGGAGDDRLEGGVGDDVLFGNDGKDTLVGGAGRDTLLGGEGLDILYGNDGNDVLYADGGNDVLVGGADSDTFVIRSTDAGIRIADFTDGEDRIDLRYLDLQGSTLESAGITFTQDGTSVMADLGGLVTIEFSNADIADFDDADFLI